MSAAELRRGRAEAYQQGLEEALAALGTGGRRGLSVAGARPRLARYGRNALAAWLATFAGLLHALLFKRGRA
jgi:hypothetical protein